VGRRDAVQFTLECAAEFRRLGARVTYEPGWESRGNGLQANYEGCSVHHTGIGSSAARPFPGQTLLRVGRPDLGGPLCNSAGPHCTVDDPWIHIVAAHPANHGGASGGRGTAPFPVTRLFNPLSWGHEIDYGGNVPMSAGQYRAALIVGRGVINVLRKDTPWIKAHAETSVTGKWDPGYAPGKTIDMAAFRRDAANISPLEDDMDVWDLVNFRPDRNQNIWDALKAIQNNQAAMSAALVSISKSPGVVDVIDTDTLSETVVPISSDQLAEALMHPEVAATIGEAIAAAMDRRARDNDPATGPST
jgi:hypothetical protein